MTCRRSNGQHNNIMISQSIGIFSSLLIFMWRDHVEEDVWPNLVMTTWKMGVVGHR